MKVELELVKTGRFPFHWYRVRLKPRGNAGTRHVGYIVRPDMDDDGSWVGILKIGAGEPKLTERGTSDAVFAELEKIARRHASDI